LDFLWADIEHLKIVTNKATAGSQAGLQCLTEGPSYSVVVMLSSGKGFLEMAL
jgi:hypothetical protein